MGISELVNKYDENFWDFNGVRKEGLHKLGKYPATMVAPMQYELLSLIVSNNTGFKTLLDPFMGSGTSLVEGNNLGLEVFGVDINAYAVLLSEVKLNKYDELELLNMKQRVSDKISDNEYPYELHEFPNINKWFREDIIDSLSKIRRIIMEENNVWIRRFLWVCMSEVIYSHSNDRTSTFKLHIKKKEDIESIRDQCFKMFERSISSSYEYLEKNDEPSVTIFSGDSNEMLSELSSESIDIICTSPPYGDNATTVTYGQATILFLKWIDFKDLSGDEMLISNYSKIDSESLGGKLNENELPPIKSIESYINSLSESKKKKVVKFFSDYYKVIEQLVRVLSVGGYMLFTVGNRRVDGIIQPLDKITREMFLSMGLHEEKIFTRSILSKKMPSKISNVSNIGAVSSMSKETILIFKKEN
ncbi:DNA methyltransferase [Listeria seeligeri]|nr:DNA methyltransferase [Listeria seeligeri]MBC1481147.1 site-specific DNA-methyltransferase [Listeria seeligeri]MBC1720581.1 site-specific DNA-methyltransferase [Listeria seeligeri]MBC1790535.1 site-specific DNA-methyltransferase [Listeria seeligeri]MBC1847179.1 site-specific DNA-methyltransferase [Listeria seeligeri]MBC1857801.1 site-specific DNA-methyltransferase [Listeria seeligeri]